MCKLPFKLNKTACTGCYSCVQVCPKNCIIKNGETLQINTELCINCGKCENVCPEININKREFRYPEEAYAVWSLDNEDRRSSTSGGAASVFYQTALKQGKIICGAVYNEALIPVLKMSKSFEDISTFKKSKYAYADSNGVYIKVRSMLLKGEKVIFISLPCQVAGLLQFLGEEHENLITVDIVCHGSPFGNVLKDYISSRDSAGKAKSLSFRQDNEFVFELTDEYRKVIYKKEGRTDEYLAAFLNGLIYRQCCYNCVYAKPERIADITIGDFWGLGVKEPFNHPYTGAISLVLINSQKGREFFEHCKPLLFYEKRSVEEAIEGNSQLKHPTPLHSKRSYYDELCTKGMDFSEAVRLCLNDEMKKEKRKLQKRKLKDFLRQIKRLIIKK